MRDYLGSGHTGFREKVTTITAEEDELTLIRKCRNSFNLLEMVEMIEILSKIVYQPIVLSLFSNLRLYYEDYVAQLTTDVEHHVHTLYHNIPNR